MNLSELYYSFPTLYQLAYLIPPGLFWRRRATQVILAELLALKNTRGKILEIGCGSGFLSRKLAKLCHDMTIFGIDSSNAMVAYASSRNEMSNLEFLALDFFKIGENRLGLDKFEVVVSLNAWSFFLLDPSIELLRKISKRGTKFIAVTYSGTPWSKLHSRILSSLFKRPLYLHQPSQFLSVLNRFGFEAEYTRIDPIEGSYLIRAVLVR